MRKKLLSGLLAATMVASLMVGCGNGGTDTSSSTPEGNVEESVDDTDAAASSDDSEDSSTSGSAVTSDDGKILNISCWNEEFKSRVTDHYPGYEEIDAKTGKIGDVEVHWNITANDDNAYQNKLDENLLNQADAAADDKIDLFLVEADYALKYVDTEYTLDIVNDLGISEDTFANQYQYTKDIVTDSNGALKGASWQGCPGVMIYRRDIAKDVFGSDDPAEVQKNFSSWEDFNKAAAALKEKGYQITSSVNDTYRVYSNNVTSPWVVDGKINIDDNIKAWVDASKEMVDNGYTTSYDLWSDEWNAGFQEASNVFCYFGPAWLIDFCMGAERNDDGTLKDNGTVAGKGGYAATTGPQGFYWGGTWICGANYTDNKSLVADIIKTMTTDADVLKEITTKDNDFVNDKPVMEEMAQDTSYGDDILGGQNALGMFCEGADKIDLSNLSAYDQGCTEEFQNAMKGYFDGNYATYEEALDAFYSAVETKYPELTH